MFQKLAISPIQLRSLIGAIIFKLGMAVTSVWGSINLYFFSQFYHQGSKITAQTNAITLLISVFPMVLSMVYAIKLCDRFGYEFVIRACSLIFLICPMVSIFSFNIYTFTIFSLIIPGCMFAISSIPILNCMWVHFPDSKNKVTSALVVAFGIGGVVWNLMSTHMINPNNLDASIVNGNINLFPPQVSNNARKTAIIGFAVTGSLALLGSMLLHKKPVHSSEQPADQVEPIEFHNEKCDSSQTVKLTQQTALSLKQAVRDERFIIIMLVSFLTGLYQIHLMMNFKIIYMPIINDDHFLSYCIMLCSLVAIGGAFIWGCLGDMKGIAFTTLVLSILDIGSKIFGDFAITKPMIVIMVILIGLISKSMTTLAGPGFVEYFGLKVGTQMLPFKGIAILLGYLIVPFFQIVTSSQLTPRDYLILISLTSIVTLGSAIRLYYLEYFKQQITEEVESAKTEVNEAVPQKQQAKLD